jgi:hypothetical protein
VKPLILCYVEDCWAYFTDKPLAEQWGDDWNDAPYEHNAGEPYEYAERLAFEGEFDQPCTNQCNSSYSVERINAGAIPWLVTSRWSSGKVVSIPAGTGIDEFIILVLNAGGEVYRKIKA